MIYFTADTHFYHTNILSYCARKFNTIYEMNERLISNWNTHISNSDEVYHLGDFAFCNQEKIKEILNRLNGRIYLILGNHDKVFRKWKYRIEWVKDFHELKVNGQRISLFHYPIQSWAGKNNGAWHLHGHSHGKIDSTGIARLDVGVDVHNFYPVSFEEVKWRFESL